MAASTKLSIRPTPGRPLVNAQTGPIAVLDGVRGVAILLVMAGHLLVVPGSSLAAHLINAAGNLGSAGIDLFFVLCGFLITGILLETRDQPHYFRNFYVRRGLRIFPIYYGYLLVYTVIRLAYPAAIDPPAIPHESLWAALFSTNILLAIKQTAISPALSHFWPLAVVVHFYLIWPLLIHLVPVKRLPWLCGGFIAAALLMRLVFWMHDDFNAGYMLTACRFDGLAVGGLVAIVCRQPRMMTRWLPAAKWVAVAALAALGAGLARRHGLKSGAGFSLTAVITLLAMVYGSALLVLVQGDRAGQGGSRTIYHRLLESAPLRFFGKYSLGLYLLHVPILLIVSDWTRNLAGNLYATRPVTWMFLNAVLVTSLSMAMAWLSWRVLENPFLKLKRYFAPRPGEVAEAGAGVRNLPAVRASAS